MELNQMPKSLKRAVIAQGFKTNGKSKNKYNNVKKDIDGIKFDSMKEAKRFLELRTLLELKTISNLKLQHTFTLQEPFTTPTGERIRAITYMADFTYFDIDGKFVVEDVKSKITAQNPEYIMKKKLMAEKYGIIINEI